jgi:hypothetical protein
MQQQIQTAKDMPYNIQNYVNIKNNTQNEIKYEIKNKRNYDSVG